MARQNSETVPDTVPVGRTPRNPTHGRLVAELVAEGWQTKGWRKGSRWGVSDIGNLVDDPTAREDVPELLDAIDETYGTPDAWRIHVEDERHGWGHKVLVLELAEVEVTHRMTADKLMWYEEMWWVFDGSGHAHFRLWRIDRFGKRFDMEETFQEMRWTRPNWQAPACW